MKFAGETEQQAQGGAANLVHHPMSDGPLLVFAGFLLDAEGNTLSREGAEVPLRPKSLALLKYLVQRRGETVSKSRLAEAVWPVPPADVDASIAQCVKDIRAALGPEARGMLQTVPGVGYAFRGAVERRDPPRQSPVAKEGSLLPAPRRMGWRIGAVVAGLVAAGGSVTGLLYLLWKDPASDPRAVHESYRYRPNRTIFNTEVVTIATDDGKTIICRGGNDGAKTPRRCWWGKPQGPDRLR